MILKYLPNILTLFRLFLIIPFLGLIYDQRYAWAFYIFIIAGFTDGLDGWLARHFNWQSQFGSFIDPLADKLLAASSFIALALLNQLPWWLVGLVFTRDLTISIGVIAWFWFIQRRLDFSPTYLSKINTLFQLVLITVCLYEIAFSYIIPNLRYILIVLTTFTTISSYIHYTWVWGKKAYVYLPSK